MLFTLAVFVYFRDTHHKPFYLTGEVKVQEGVVVDSQGSTL